MRATTVLFDLDGTLTNSELAITNSYVEVCQTLCLPRPSPEQIRSFIGPPLEVTWAALAPDPEIAKRGVLLYRERYARHGASETTVYPGIAAMLQMLTEAGVRMSVATSKDEPNAKAVLDHLKLTSLFDTVVGAARDGSRHHKDDVIGEVLRRLAVPASDAVMAGDRDHDVIGARRHGIDTVGVLWGFGDRLELESAGARWLVTQPSELSALVLAD